GLFGGDLSYVHSYPGITPNPSTPQAESWFVSLGQEFLSITPTFPQLKMGVDMDHIAPSVSGFNGSVQNARSIAKSNDLDIVTGPPTASGENDLWLYSPDRLIFQLGGGGGGARGGAPATGGGAAQGGGAVGAAAAAPRRSNIPGPPTAKYL